jgi:2-keto-4-pentenoate hydratase/2-oxohepta-3-ene-1,7-dioic acid hydratase in catechol pathway
MKICRFNQSRLGVIDQGSVLDVTAALSVLPAESYPYPVIDALIAHLDSVRDEIEQIRHEARKLRLKDVKLLAPVANPGKLVGAPVNYLKHLEEARAQPELHHNNQIEQIQRAGLFLKATSSLIGPGEPVRIRFPDRRSDHEIELAVIIGKTADRVAAKHALDHVAGYTIGLDMTVRGPEERSLRKSVDTYSVLGPWLVTADEFGSPANVDLELKVNGQMRQQANTRDLVLTIPELIEFASRFYTLHPGDVIFGGTPEGVGPVVAGDSIQAKISNIGTMTVNVLA